MKSIFAVLAIASQASAQTPNVSASLQELRLQRTAFARYDVGPVFDLRNQLELSFSRAKSEPTAESIRLTDALNRYAQLLTNAESATSLVQKIRPDSTAIENRAAVGDLARLTINSVDLLNHITPGAGDELTELAAVAPGGALGKYLAFMRQLNVVARDGKAQIARAIDDAKTKVTVDITVRREERQGRTYPTNPLSLLTLSPEDEKFRDHLNATDLRAALAKAKSQGIDDLRQLVNNTLTAPIADLKAVAATVPDALSRIDTVLASIKSNSVGDPEALVASILSGLTTLQAILGQESLTPYRERANAVVTAAKALANQLPDEVKKLVSKLTTIGATIETAHETRDLLLAAGESQSLLIGPPSEKPRLNEVSLDLQNGDTVIVVARENDGAPFFTKSVRGYRLGWNLVRTITYVGYAKRGSSQTGTSPAYNFVTKCFRRGSTFQNTFGSVGYGVTTFPLGVNQNGSDSAQTALGLTLSLLDDWFQVGYARNLSSSKNFLFVGAQIPLRLGK